MQIKPFVSYAGYSAAVTLISGMFTLIFLQKHHTIETIGNPQIFSIVGITFFVMLLSEYIQRRLYRKKYHITDTFSSLSNSYLYLLKSTFYRFLALFIPFYLAYFTVHRHFYFIHNQNFAPTILVFDYFLTIFLYIAPLYIFLTLRFKGARTYEFNDYAILTIIGIRALILRLFKQKSLPFYRNRRVKKVWLLYMVNFFFLTLMIQFFANEFHHVQNYISQYWAWDYTGKTWFEQYKIGYNILFHLIFFIDVGIALIGYSFASRWLDNRTKSIDTTLFGWLIALAAYPPFNSFIGSNFIFYDGLDTHNIIISDIGISIILTLLILLYTIYVWSTIALGFKFSNLTNRGIISHGPYAYVRHPAYASKNLAWIIDYTYVYTNIWATLAFLAWNAIYVLRALTEERHLKQDSAYQEYSKKVKYKFIPKLI